MSNKPPPGSDQEKEYYLKQFREIAKAGLDIAPFGSHKSPMREPSWEELKKYQSIMPFAFPRLSVPSPAKAPEPPKEPPAVFTTPAEESYSKPPVKPHDLKKPHDKDQATQPKKQQPANSK